MIRVQIRPTGRCLWAVEDQREDCPLLAHHHFQQHLEALSTSGTSRGQHQDLAWEQQLDWNLCHICLQLFHCSSDSKLFGSAGMKHLLVLVLGLPYVVGIGGGSVSGDCPAECRCESVGTLQRVNCVNAGLRSLPPNLSSFTLSLWVHNSTTIYLLYILILYIIYT